MELCLTQIKKTMKSTFKILIILLSTFYQKGYSQQLVQNIGDLYRLKENESQFLNKPLKDLLKEIKPEIKVAFAYNDPSMFDFRFITTEQRRKKEGNRVSLFVYVRDLIDWRWDKRPKDKETVWSKEDPEKYGNLIVTHISIVYR